MTESKSPKPKAAKAKDTKAGKRVKELTLTADEWDTLTTDPRGPRDEQVRPLTERDVRNICYKRDIAITEPISAKNEADFPEYVAALKRDRREREERFDAAYPGTTEKIRELEARLERVEIDTQAAVRGGAFEGTLGLMDQADVGDKPLEGRAVTTPSEADDAALEGALFASEGDRKDAEIKRLYGVIRNSTEKIRELEAHIDRVREVSNRDPRYGSSPDEMP